VPPCPECGAPQVIGAFVEGPWLSRPVSFIRMPRHITGLNTAVCLGCGRVQQYAADVAELRRYVEEHPDRFRW
jgi:hypothetical protein